MSIHGLLRLDKLKNIHHKHNKKLAILSKKLLWKGFLNKRRCKENSLGLPEYNFP
jgi:hypothetical protein